VAREDGTDINVDMRLQRDLDMARQQLQRKRKDFEMTAIRSSLPSHQIVDM
jgi:hypothetical protein